MFHEITDMTSNLLFTRSGTVWAGWRLQSPLPYGYRPDEEKAAVRDVHTALYRALGGEALLLGVCGSTDPGSVVERMIDGVDLDQHEAWAAECEATLDLLEGIELGLRTFWLWVPLANTGLARVREPVRAASARMKDTLAMPRVTPSRAVVEARKEQAAQIAKAIPRVLMPRPTAVSEAVWLFWHAAHRGLGVDLSVPEPGQPGDQLRAGCAVPTVFLDEAGRSDEEMSKVNPVGDLMKRRYLKVVEADTGQTSYQTMLAFTDTPPGGIVFPGGEWLGRLDECGEVVDWAQRLTIRSRAEVTRRNAKANRNLNDQLDQREGESRVGGASHLEQMAVDLAEYQALIDSDQLEVEVQATTILSVGAEDPETCLDLARQVSAHYAPAEFKVEAPLAAQEELWWASLPGIATSTTVRKLAQVTTAANLAAATPLTSTELGDPTGSLLALEITGGRPSPVLIDLDGASTNLNVSMAVAFVAELGAGKSVGEKTIVGDVVDRGGQGILVDRTQSREWAVAMGGIEGAQVVDVSSAATCSIDPLRLFEPHVAARVLQTFLTSLLNVPPTSDLGVTLSDVLDPLYLSAHQITSTGDLLEHLSTVCEVPGARELAGKIRVFATKDFGRTIFDPDLPPLDLAAPVICFETSDVPLPSHDELNVAHRFATMSLEKLFGRAIFALIVTLSRTVLFADRTRPGVFGADETHAFTIDPTGAEELLTIVRDGRKHRTGAVLGSHDAYDFGDPRIQGLISFRVVMRHRDENLARRGVRWLLGLPEDKPVPQDLVDIITKDTSPIPPGDNHVAPERLGECLIRDFRARIGRGKILAPCLPERAERVFTTPADPDVEDVAA